jgi:hypothetical protein
MGRYNTIKQILQEGFNSGYDKQKPIDDPQEIENRLKQLPAERAEKIRRLLESTDEMIKLEEHKLVLLRQHRIGLIQKYLPRDNAPV